MLWFYKYNTAIEQSQGAYDSLNLFLSERISSVLLYKSMQV